MQDVWLPHLRKQVLLLLDLQLAGHEPDIVIQLPFVHPAFQSTILIQGFIACLKQVLDIEAFMPVGKTLVKNLIADDSLLVQRHRKQIE